MCSPIYCLWGDQLIISQVFPYLVELFRASFCGGLLSFILSKHFASSNPLILWVGENPLNAVDSVSFPPDKAPRGRSPLGVRPFNCRTLSLSSLRTVKTRAIFPMARILFLITSFLAATAPSVTKANTHSWTNPAKQNSTRDLPEHSEHPSHFSNGSNFVTDHLFSSGYSTSWKIMAIIKLHQWKMFYHLKEN